MWKRLQWLYCHLKLNNTYSYYQGSGRRKHSYFAQCLSLYRTDKFTVFCLNEMSDISASAHSSFYNHRDVLDRGSAERFFAVPKWTMSGKDFISGWTQSLGPTWNLWPKTFPVLSLTHTLCPPLTNIEEPFSYIKHRHSQSWTERTARRLS